MVTSLKILKLDDLPGYIGGRAESNHHADIQASQR
jgi:hypothetical protein